ncbi:MAG TPA: SgcJ/EcaC family oxidoreductase [Pyrinomonadaceae bacterium]|nr:SgcJ/EcaC family oxidoreductase [Pyrinomonadaceae bacterium]
MTARLRTLAALFILLAGLQTAAAQTTTPAAAASDDEKTLRQIVKQVEDAWNAHDGKAFAAPFAADADYVVVNGMYIKGREEIERGHTQIFTTFYKESTNAATVKGVRFLRPDVAVVHVEWNMMTRPGAERARAMNTMVFTKDGGKWSISAFHNTPVQTTQR